MWFLALQASCVGRYWTQKKNSLIGNTAYALKCKMSDCLNKIIAQRRHISLYAVRTIPYGIFSFFFLFSCSIMFFFFSTSSQNASSKKKNRVKIMIIALECKKTGGN